MFKIYGLVCPISGNVRYIGKTKNTLAGRLKGHLSGARTFRYHHHAARWIRVLLRNGLAPEIVLLEETEGDWVEAEVRWIAKGKAFGWPLTNSTVGGDGAPDPTPDVLQRRKRAMQAVWESPDYVRRIREARNDPKFIAEQAGRLRNRWKDKDARRKMMDSRWPAEKREAQAKAILDRQQKIKAAITPEVIARRNAAIKASWIKRKAAKV